MMTARKEYIQTTGSPLGHGPYNLVTNDIASGIEALNLFRGPKILQLHERAQRARYTARQACCPPSAGFPAWLVVTSRQEYSQTDFESAGKMMQLRE